MFQIYTQRQKINKMRQFYTKIIVHRAKIDENTFRYVKEVKHSLFYPSVFN